jgi:hypothetical protein
MRKHILWAEFAGIGLAMLAAATRFARGDSPTRKSEPPLCAKLLGDLAAKTN